MDTKDEIRSRLPIEQVVAQYCQLKKKGRNFVALCPFHQDSNPSLLVSPDKGIAYCFACQSGGDIFSFVQKVEGVDFPEAVKILAEKAGVEIKHEKRGPTVSKDERDRLKECLVSASAFYMSSLAKNPKASAYLQSRGVKGDLKALFQVGYAPDSFSETYDQLLKAGYSKSEIVAAGLGVNREIGDGKMYDRFRDRIMFPIRDSQGTIIGFGGRTLGDSDAKYVNSPESLLYHKSSVLFGLYEAKEEIRKTRRVLLVEGYFDCIACHKAGVKNVVAVSGTALTAEHTKILRRYADDVVLCLDQDRAGELAAARAFGLLSQVGMNILSITLPAKDPDELIQKDAMLFKNIVETAPTAYITAVIDKLHERKDLQTPAGKRAISETLFPLLAALNSSVELRSFLEQAASVFSMVQSELFSDFKVWQSKEIATPVHAASSPESEADHGYSRIELAFGVALVYPELAGLLSELITEEGGEHRTLVTALQAGAEAVSALDPLLREKLGVLGLYAEEHFASWSNMLATKEMKKMITLANRDAVKKKQMDVVLALKNARTDGRKDDEATLLVQYQNLLKLGQMTER
ncbi:MAG: DNA primase [Candidatus Peribacteraceae bacterium]